MSQFVVVAKVNFKEVEKSFTFYLGVCSSVLGAKRCINAYVKTVAHISADYVTQQIITPICRRLVLNGYEILINVDEM